LTMRTRQKLGVEVSIKYIDRAYIAGFFDGEGCISFPTPARVQITIGQKDPGPLRWIQMKYGGKVYDIGGLHRLVFTKNSDKLKFLEEIRPYLRLEHRQEKADKAIKILKRKRQRRLSRH
jgi:hypothetical protein